MRASVSFIELVSKPETFLIVAADEIFGWCDNDWMKTPVFWRWSTSSRNDLVSTGNI